MHLKDVFNGIDFRTKDNISNVRINGVKDDSRAVADGDLFVAVKGHAVDGNKFIGAAIKKGAIAVLSDAVFSAPAGVKKILVNDARAALPLIAANFYGHPSEGLKLVGVTGTNGKTTITYLIESIIKSAGEDAGVIGTVNYRIKEKVLPAKNTTPGPVELQSMLADMKRGGVHYAIMEVSSHSLDQGRVGNVLFDAGIFTNITSEHLDYHKTISRYFAAKARLFDKLKQGGMAILNNDDERVVSLKKLIRKNVITYGINRGSDIRAESIKISLNGSLFKIATPQGRFDMHTRLIGRHNISNILASVAAAYALNIRREDIVKGVAALYSVPGRLEEVNAGQRFKAFVDYAHTEDALYNILTLLKEVANRRIITVFGCGGNRDRTKRPLMGKVACTFYSRVIITSDNPRFEDPKKIIAEIEGGVKHKFRNYDIIPDRRLAIQKALGMAGAGDIVVVAGKGHETYQIIKDKVMPFDDREVVRQLIKKIV